MPRLDVELRESQSALDRLLAIHDDLHQLSLTPRRIVAELLLLRAFDIFEFHISRIAAKIVAGALYLDGSAPNVIRSARSMAGAETEMRNYGRSKVRNLKWSTAKAIKANLLHVLDRSDDLVVRVDNHGGFIDEVRRIRNRIAHTNSNTRAAFQVVVRRNYGASSSALLPGAFLLSTRWQPNKLEDYLLKTRLLLRVVMNG